MNVTDRLLPILDRAAAVGATQVVIVPGDGTRICRPSWLGRPPWEELLVGAEYQFTHDELRGIDRSPAELGAQSGTHTVLLNYRDPRTGVTTTVWELPDNGGGHIRLGTAHYDQYEEEHDGNES